MLNICAQIFNMYSEHVMGQLVDFLSHDSLGPNRCTVGMLLYGSLRVLSAQMSALSIVRTRWLTQGRQNSSCLMTHGFMAANILCWGVHWLTVATYTPLTATATNAGIIKTLDMQRSASISTSPHECITMLLCCR